MLLALLLLLFGAQKAGPVSSVHVDHTDPNVCIVKNDHGHRATLDLKSPMSLIVTSDDWSALPANVRDAVKVEREQHWGNKPGFNPNEITSWTEADQARFQQFGSGRIMCGAFSQMPCQTSGRLKGCGCAPQAEKDKLSALKPFNGPPEKNPAFKPLPLAAPGTARLHIPAPDLLIGRPPRK